MPPAKLILILIMLAFLSSTSFRVTSAQEASSTAVADTSTHPEFGITALGDYARGYFDDVPVRPGETVSLKVQIYNSGHVVADLRTFKVNAHSNVNGGYISGDEKETPIGATNWITYPAREVTLAPGEADEITFDATVPEGTPPGQYISGLVVQTSEPLEVQGAGNVDYYMAYAISVGILVPGEIVQDFGLGDPSIVSEGGLLLLRVPITNDGNYLVRPSGELRFYDNDATEVFVAPIELGSVYAGASTTIELVLPEQTPSGDYTLTLALSDEASGARASLENASVTVPVSEDFTGISVTSANISANDTLITFANVDIAIRNGGKQIPASNVTLEVLHNGELVEEYPLATNQVLLEGENQYTDRYIPAEMWESGTYTFNLVVSAVDPNGGQETILLDEELEATIEVP